eukprot:6202078-Pleurochrysis_carterae.AAC.1
MRLQSRWAHQRRLGAGRGYGRHCRHSESCPGFHLSVRENECHDAAPCMVMVAAVQVRYPEQRSGQYVLKLVHISVSLV